MVTALALLSSRSALRFFITGNVGFALPQSGEQSAMGNDDTKNLWTV